MLWSKTGFGAQNGGLNDDPPIFHNFLQDFRWFIDPSVQRTAAQVPDHIVNSPLRNCHVSAARWGVLTIQFECPTNLSFLSKNGVFTKGSWFGKRPKILRRWMGWNHQKQFPMDDLSNYYTRAFWHSPRTNDGERLLCLWVVTFQGLCLTLCGHTIYLSGSIYHPVAIYLHGTVLVSPFVHPSTISGGGSIDSSSSSSSSSKSSSQSSPPLPS